ncbi:MAG: 1-acyl-sn-glycerol-3-phosphate acyltransferase, partial [Bacteroidota bacterium]
PEFILSWLERLIHQEEVNAFFEKHADSDQYTFCKSAIEKFNLRFTLNGLSQIPAYPQKVIFAANHPLGGMDAISMILLLKDVRPDLKFIVNDLLLAVTNLKDRFIGVNKVGKNAVASLQKVEEQFSSGTATFIFPAGLVSRKTKGKIRDLEWKKTFIAKAKKYDIPIIPVHIGGRLTNRFYRLANLRKLIGIKINIEMLFLVDELFKQENMQIDIQIGKAIPSAYFDTSKNNLEWAQFVKETVYDLVAK